uniref:Hexosyltransferase n=1 Tax=Steinernema glaseri TaxID=37863 RepID=A0A1I7YG14_9BILA
MIPAVMIHLRHDSCLKRPFAFRFLIGSVFSLRPPPSPRRLSPLDMKGIKFTNRCVFVGAGTFLIFVAVFVLFSAPYSESLSDLEKTHRILKRDVNQVYLQNESIGPFLESDWTEDISGVPLFSRTGPPLKCDENVELLVGVISRPHDVGLRRTIRRTWADRSRYDTRRTRVLFFLGREKNVSIQREMDTYGDIIPINNDEGYYNLTLKTYALLTYHRDYCGQAKCVLKIDTDVVANLAGLEELCRQNAETPLITGGGGMTWATVGRSTSSKYYVPHYVYNFEFYPPYAEGPAYLYSGGANVSSLVLDALRKTPFHQSENFRRLPEDVVFNGIARSLAEIPVAANSGFTLYKSQDLGYWCPSDGSPLPLIRHGAEPLEEHWRRFKEAVVDANEFSWFGRVLTCGFR